MASSSIPRTGSDVEPRTVASAAGIAARLKTLDHYDQARPGVSAVLWASCRALGGLDPLTADRAAICRDAVAASTLLYFVPLTEVLEMIDRAAQAKRRFRCFVAFYRAHGLRPAMKVQLARDRVVAA